MTVNTNKGLYRYNRLPFGVSSAPSIFQRTMDNLMRGIKGVSTYIDDILISGSTINKHLETLNVVLQKLETAGLKLNKSKCFFCTPRVEYLGHIIDKVDSRGASNSRGTEISQHERAPIIFWHNKLLQSFPSELIH